MIHLACQYFLNHDLREKELRTQVRELANAGYDPEFGARPVKRAIQDYVLNDLSKKLLAEEVSREKPIIIDANGAGLVFRN